MKKSVKDKINKSRADQIVFYNLVKDDANILDKMVKWIIIVHYPLYIGLWIFDLFTVRYNTDGYIGPASMVFPMSFTGSIILEIAYFIIMTYVSMALAISMSSYKKLKLKQAITRYSKK